jgi:gliding motility-associated-like protein
LNLSVIPLETKTINASICVNQTYPFGSEALSEPGIYTDTILSAIGCDTILTLNLSVQDSSKITIESSDQYICQDGEQEVTLNITVEAGEPAEIAWYDNERTPVLLDGTSSRWNIIPTDNESVYWAYAVDAVCGNSDTVFTTVYATNKVYLILDVNTTKVQIGESVTLTVNPTNDEHGSYKWYDAFTGNLLGETTVNVFTCTLDKEGSYAFYVLTDNELCSDSESWIVTVDVADFVIIPNIITPYNKNSKNDTFMTPKEDRPGYKVTIYNRYQQLVFEGENGWDGTYRGKLAEPGTYFYRLIMKDGKELKGTIEVAKF